MAAADRAADRAAGARDPVLVAAAAEGVTCDVCHSIAEVELGPGGGSYTMRLASRAKYGPLCDAEDHYFHTMACSPLHQSAEFCGPCHQLIISTGPLGLPQSVPVYTTYSEWQESPHATGGVSCQDCHMPGQPGEVAVGAGEREGVSEHGFLDADLLGRAAVLGLRIVPDNNTDTHSALRIDYEIHNSGAGHALPTGLPARRLVLRARARDAAGRVTGQAQVSFGRVLVDDAGQVVPFVRATRQAEDTRIAAGERRVGHLVLASHDLPGPAPGWGAAPGFIDIELVLQAYAPEIAAALGLGAPAEHIMLHTRRDLPGPGAGPGDPTLRKQSERERAPERPYKWIMVRP
jgi:hypothetical protein